MAVTEPYQFEYVAGGHTVAMGPSADTPNIDVVRVSGLLDSTVEDSDRDFARFDGDVPGLHRLEPRYVKFELEVRGEVGEDYDDLVNDTIDNFKRRFEVDGVLTFMFPGFEVPRWVRCRPVRRRIARDARTEFGLLPIDIEFKAADPRMYSDLVTSGSESGTFVVVNDGNDPAFPILNFGGVANAKLTNNTNGDVIEISGATGSGSLIADMDRYIRATNQLIVYRGSTDNYGKWLQPRKPFTLNRGSNSLTLNTGTNVTVDHYPTYV